MASKARAQPVSARTDAVRVYPKHYAVEVENDGVRALRIRYGPHEESIMRGHPARVAVFLTNGHHRFTYPDAGTEQIRAKAAQVQQFDAFEHNAKNLSDQPLEGIGIELRSLPSAQGLQ